MHDLIAVERIAQWEKLKTLVREERQIDRHPRRELAVATAGAGSLSAPDISTVRGLRDRAILAVLLGCGLRRSEVAALTFARVQQRDGRWCIVDLVGKHGRVRTAPMPSWVKVAVDGWTAPAGVRAGHVFRPVNRAGLVTGERLGEKVVWQMLRQYAAEVGVPGIAPWNRAPRPAVVRKHYGKWAKGRHDNIDRLMLAHFQTAAATTPVTEKSHENSEAVN